jgi:hypothetical protein
MRPRGRVLASVLFVVATTALLTVPLWSSSRKGDPTTVGTHPHWEFAVLLLRPTLEESDRQIRFEAEQKWIGPIPYEGTGTVCQVIAFDRAGNVTHRDERFYVADPQEEWERSGASLGANLPLGSADAEITCEPFSGNGFEVVGEPELTTPPGLERAVVGTAQLRWNEPKLQTASFWCDVSLFDAKDELVRRSIAGPNAAFWPPGDFKGRPPYIQQVHFLFRLRDDAPEPVRAEMNCSLEPPT